MGIIINAIEDAIQKHKTDILVGGAVAVVGGIILGLLIVPFVG
jgi:hypothetical protein